MIASTSRSMASAVIDAPDSGCDVDVVDNGVVADVDDVGTGSIPGFIVVSRNLDVGDYECPVEGLPVDENGSAVRQRRQATASSRKPERPACGPASD